MHKVYLWSQVKFGHFLLYQAKLSKIEQLPWLNLKAQKHKNTGSKSEIQRNQIHLDLNKLTNMKGFTKQNC